MSSLVRVPSVVPVKDARSRPFVSNLDDIVRSHAVSIKGTKDLIPGAVTKVSFLNLKRVDGGLKDRVYGSVYKVPIRAVD